MATDIPKGLKIAWLVNAVVCFGYAVLYGIITETFMAMLGWPYNDVFFPRVLGGTLAALGIFCVIAARADDWEKVSIFLKFQITWITLALVVNIWGLIVLTIPPATMVMFWLNNAVLLLFNIVYIYYILKMAD